MNYREIQEKITNKEYDSKFPYPPYRPDKVERERYKVQDAEAKRIWHDDEYNLKQLFKHDLRQYLESEIERPITDKQFDAVFNKAWDDGHSNGYNEVLMYASDLIDIVKIFINSL